MNKNKTTIGCFILMIVLVRVPTCTDLSQRRPSAEEVEAATQEALELMPERNKVCAEYYRDLDSWFEEFANYYYDGVEMTSNPPVKAAECAAASERFDKAARKADRLALMRFRNWKR